MVANAPFAGEAVITELRPPLGDKKTYFLVAKRDTNGGSLQYDTISFSLRPEMDADLIKAATPFVGTGETVWLEYELNGQFKNLTSVGGLNRSTEVDTPTPTASPTESVTTASPVVATNFTAHGASEDERIARIACTKSAVEAAGPMDQTQPVSTYLNLVEEITDHLFAIAGY